MNVKKQILPKCGVIRILKLLCKPDELLNSP